MDKKKLMDKVRVVKEVMMSNQEAADDFMALLHALPPGQVKNLLKDETCGAILRKYGITG